MTVTDILPMVSPYVVDCPQGVQYAAIRRALRTFLGETGIWRETLDCSYSDFGIDASVDLAALMPGDGRTLIRAYDIQRDDESLPFYTTNIDKNLYLHSPPVSGDFVVYVVYGATDALNPYPDVLEQYSDGIADLALFFVLNTNRRPYTDPKGAIAAYNRYRVARERAKHDVITMGGSGEIVNPLPECF